MVHGGGSSWTRSGRAWLSGISLASHKATLTESKLHLPVLVWHLLAQMDPQAHLLDVDQTAQTDSGATVCTEHWGFRSSGDSSSMDSSQTAIQ
jgi:hypothetical protein